MRSRPFSLSIFPLHFSFFRLVQDLIRHRHLGILYWIKALSVATPGHPSWKLGVHLIHQVQGLPFTRSWKCSPNWQKRKLQGSETPLFSLLPQDKQSWGKTCPGSGQQETFNWVDTWTGGSWPPSRPRGESSLVRFAVRSRRLGVRKGPLGRSCSVLERHVSLPCATHPRRPPRFIFSPRSYSS